MQTDFHEARRIASNHHEGRHRMDVKQSVADRPRKPRAAIVGLPVGEMIRDLRTARGVTIAELAENIGRSVGYISQVERDQSGITIATLQQVADALSVGINWFFQGQANAPADERDVIVRKGNRRILDLSAKGVVQELLSPTLTGQIELMITTFQPVSRTGRGGRMRKSEEAGVLLTGTLDLHVDGKCFRLTAGDSYSLRHKGRHRFENRGEVPAVLVCVVTPPSAY
jgi:transcriptional regulator with XRE-family HTH domain